MSFWELIAHTLECWRNVSKNFIQEQNDFYIADTRGIAIWNGDKIEVDVEGSGQRARECDWTLEQYIHLSSAKFFSKARFYCVKKPKGTFGGEGLLLARILIYNSYLTIETPSDEDGAGSGSGMYLKS